MSYDNVDNDSRLQSIEALGIIQAQHNRVVHAIAGLPCMLMQLHQTSVLTGTYETAYWILLPMINEQQ